MNEQDEEGKKLRAEVLSLLRRCVAIGVGTDDDIVELEQKQDIAEMTGSDLLSNIRKEEEPFILQAAKDTGFDIYVEQEALDYKGRKIKGYVGVYTRDIYKNHSLFWRRFEDIRSKNEY